MSWQRTFPLTICKFFILPNWSHSNIMFVASRFLRSHIPGLHIRVSLFCASKRSFQVPEVTLVPRYKVSYYIHIKGYLHEPWNYCKIPLKLSVDQLRHHYGFGLEAVRQVRFLHGVLCVCQQFCCHTALQARRRCGVE